ncbi:MAG: hypothetical protein Ta2F_09550 [Termitinemataceae bacterium]|nr:MAG: hypothetical protein Ta2F_09550 [Termitinemataceae bacterium]
MEIEESRPVDESKITSNDLHFYYSREKRLAKAPQSVRDLYKPLKPKRFGFFSSLVDTKPKAMMFIGIVILSITILLYTYVMPQNPLLIGNEITASALEYQGATFVVITKTANTKQKSILDRVKGFNRFKNMPQPIYTGIVDVTVAEYTQNADSPEAEVNKSNHQFFFSDSEQEDFRFQVPFKTKELFIYMQAEGKVISIKVPVN